ncbi:MAG: MarR family transcriptional regulator [Actinobacteria bacterium]|nr:MarR family transcriptional regulator [Actinomycetota bacterium]
MTTTTGSRSKRKAEVESAAAREKEEAFATAWEAFVLALRRSRARNRDPGSRLSLSQWDLLRGLGTGEQLSVGALAAAAGITPATATRVLDGLERDGVVRRLRSVGDRRTVAVSLTAEGRRRMQRTRRWLADRERLLLDRLAPDEREGAARLLGHLAEIIEEL